MSAATFLETVWVIDKAKVSAEIREGLANGKLRLSASNGNAYWAANSGRSGIAAQLPLRPATPDEQVGVEQLLKLGQAVKSAQGAAVIATAVSTVVVVAVVVAATAYLAARIDQVSAAVADVAEGLSLQDLREYARAQSKFTSTAKRASDLLKPGLPVSELRSPAELVLNELTAQREMALSFVGRLCEALDKHRGTNESRYAQALDFMVATLDWIPVSLNIERDLLLLCDKPALADQRRVQGAAEFRAAMAQFRKWSEYQYQLLATGRLGFVDTLLDRRSVLRELMDSDVHAFLLGDSDGDSAFEALLRRPRPSGPGGAAAAHEREGRARNA